MSATDFIDMHEFGIMPPCRDTRVLAWLISSLGIDVLLGAIAEQTGGTLSERMRREDARRRIEELGQQA